MKARALTLLVTIFCMSGCTILKGVCVRDCRREQHESTSLVEFLYPHGSVPPSTDVIPELRIPLRVGLAFLPSQRDGGVAGLEAARRDQLLEQVRARFTARKFVNEIVIIPDYYLKGTSGAAGLASVQRLYGIDVIALVSYDQVTYLEENPWSFSYLTIVGGYVVKGNHHDVVTLVDLAVVDPATRSLVLRAGGTDTRHGNTTLIGQQRASRESAAAGLTAASGQMIDNFDVALTTFEQRVRDGKANLRVVNRSDGRVVSGGGGAVTVPFLLVLAALGCRKRRNMMV